MYHQKRQKKQNKHQATVNRNMPFEHVLNRKKEITKMVTAGFSECEN